MGEDVGSHNFAFLMTEVVHQKKRDYLNYELDFVGRKFNENSKNFINLKDKNVNEEIYKVIFLFSFFTPLIWFSLQLPSA